MIFGFAGICHNRSTCTQTYAIVASYDFSWMPTPRDQDQVASGIPPRDVVPSVVSEPTEMAQPFVDANSDETSVTARVNEIAALLKVITRWFPLFDMWVYPTSC